MDETARFWAKVDAADCWLWTATLNPDGYGRFRPSGRATMGAHRWAYEHLVGPIPNGLVVDHLCRVRHCVNPDHMELVLPGTNTKRGYGPSSLNGRRARCSKGHEFDQATRQRICRECRNEYLRTRGDELRRAAGVPVGREAWKSRTECPQGHPYDEANTWIGKDGFRRCKTCLRAASREAKRRKREAAKASQ